MTVRWEVALKSIVGTASRVFVVAVSLGLAACATQNIDQGYALSEASGKGVVIGSIVRKGARGEFRLFYRQVAGGEKGYFAYGLSFGGQLPSFDKDDIRARGLKGALFAAELPAGDYEIYSWQVDSGPAHISPAAPFSIEFHVLPGKAVYLGRFTFERTEHLLTATTGVAVSCRDQREQDMPIFAAKYPSLAQVEIASSIEKDRSYEDIGEGNATDVRIYIPIIIAR
jgi:hypothetical protein